MFFEIKILPGCWDDHRACVSRWHCSFTLLVLPLTQYKKRQRLRNINRILCHSFDCECVRVGCLCKIHSCTSHGWMHNWPNICTDPLQCAEKNFNKWSITGDEMWVYVYNAKTKHRSSQRKSKSSPPPGSTKCDKAQWIEKDAQCFNVFWLLRSRAVEFCCQMSNSESRILLHSLQTLWNK